MGAEPTPTPRVNQGHGRGARPCQKSDLLHALGPDGPGEETLWLSPHQPEVGCKGGGVVVLWGSPSPGEGLQQGTQGLVPSPWDTGLPWTGSGCWKRGARPWEGCRGCSYPAQEKPLCFEASLKAAGSREGDGRRQVSQGVYEAATGRTLRVGGRMLLFAAFKFSLGLN